MEAMQKAILKLYQHVKIHFYEHGHKTGFNILLGQANNHSKQCIIKENSVKYE